MIHKKGEPMGKRKVYAYIGNWSFQAKPEKGKGISIFSFDEDTGDLKLIETIDKDVAAGQLYLDSGNQILYSNDECGERRGEIGGGGYLLAYKIDPATGKLTKMNRKDSLCPEPSYLCLDKSGKYLVTCHCSDPWHVTKIVKRDDGTYGNEVLFDDTGLVLFRIEEDGSLGEVCDVAVTPGSGGKDENAQVNVDPVSGHIQLVRVLSRLHAVLASPSGEMLVVCDKGMDKVYTYRIDRENGKLVYLNAWSAPEVACFPRYAAFHPTKNVLYVNNENFAQLNAFHYDEETGALERFHKVYLLPEDPGMVDGKPVGAQDILVHPNGRTLYCTLCGLNLIVVCRLDEDGVPTPVQQIQSRGNLPRGIALSPDGRFLLSGNMVSGDVTVFAADEDGMLTDTGKTFEAVSPSAIRMMVVE
jgi:6-phosphogluconolactonase (cycloisomerase 2 family)